MSDDELMLSNFMLTGPHEVQSAFGRLDAERDRLQRSEFAAREERDSFEEELADAINERDRLRAEVTVRAAAADAAAEAVGAIAEKLSATLADNTRLQGLREQLHSDVARMGRKYREARDERDRLRAVVSAYHTGLSMVISVTDIDFAHGYARAALDVSPIGKTQKRAGALTPNDRAAPSLLGGSEPADDQGGTAPTPRQPMDAIDHTRLGHYLSTYCLHDEHENCRLACKICEAPCRCACHASEEDGP